MNFGIVVLIVLAVCSVVSILVSVTIGTLADWRDDGTFQPVAQDERRDRPDRIAS